MFGEGYKEIESLRQLESGHYVAKIVKVEGKQGNYGAYVQCEVQIKDNPNVNPHIFLLNDAPKSGTQNYSQEQMHEMWCKTMTSFFDAFQIQRGNFNINSWVGKVGKITVRPQKKKPEYMEIVPYKVNPNPQPKKENTSSFGDGFSNGETESQPSNSGFPEDIPF